MDYSSLRVTSQTTLDQLQRFSDAAGDNAKIRGKKNDDGSITLYASTKKGTGAANKFLGGRSDRQDAARQAVGMVLSGAGGRQLDVATASVLAQLPKGELRGTGLATTLGQVQAARTQAAQLPGSRAEVAETLHRAMTTRHPDQIKQATAELGSYIGQYMLGKSADEQLDFVLSRGDGLKNRFLGDMAIAHGAANSPLATTYAQADPQLKAILDEAYTQALDKLPNRHAGQDRLELNGVVYSKDRALAAGGFGTIDVYKAANGHEIAVKTSIVKAGEKASDKFDEAAREIEAHRSAAAGNPTNVIGLKGAVRTPEGGLQIAMELASGGSAFDKIDGLNGKVKDGTITQREANMARLTMIKDMLEGLRHVQEVRGMAHLDVKGPNFFVDANGVTKLGDFGTARQGDVAHLNSKLVDNPLWKAPEMIKGGNERGEQVSALKKAAEASRRAAVDEIDKSLPPKEQDKLRLNIKQDRDARLDRQADQVTYAVTSKVDTWSVGIEAYRAFMGVTPFDSSFLSESEQMITDFAADPSNRVRIPHNDNPEMSTDDFLDLNDLLGGLLHPDPSQRLSLSDALDMPIFQMPGVGGQAARDIIKAA